MHFVKTMTLMYVFLLKNMGAGGTLASTLQYIQTQHTAHNISLGTAWTPLKQRTS